MQWCIGGQCVPTGRNVAIPSEAGGWSDWKDGPCSSGCLVRSKGAIVSERECDKPKPSDVLHRCEGPSVRATLCDDTNFCTDKKVRQSAVEYAGQQCIKFSAVVPTIDPAASGFQADYSASKSSNKVWSEKIKITLKFLSHFRTSVAVVRNLLQEEGWKRFLYTAIGTQQSSEYISPFPRRNLVW